MSGHQYPGSGLENQTPLPFTVPGIAGQVLRVRTETWDVSVTNTRTGQVRYCTCRTTSSEEAVTRAYHHVTDNDPDFAFDEYDICVTLSDGVRKLWDVVPIERDNTHALREPSLIGRVVAVDEDEAVQAALAAFPLKDLDFSVRQV